MNFGSALDALVGAFLFWFAVGVAGITAALIYGVPWLWSLVKPWLHSITA